MKRTEPGTVPLLTSGVWLAGAAAWGLPWPIAIPVAGTLLVLLALVLLRRLSTALTWAVTLVVLATAVRYHHDPSAEAAFATSTLMVLLVLTSLPFTIRRRLPTFTTLALSAAGGGLSMLMLALTRSVDVTGPVPYVLGLAASGAAYGLTLPSRRPFVHLQDRDAAGGA